MEAAPSKTPLPAPSIDEQLAAVGYALDTARGVLKNIIGTSAGFVELRASYQQRIRALEAVLVTLREAKRAQQRPPLSGAA